MITTKEKYLFYLSKMSSNLRICIETFVDNAELHFGVSPLAALQDLSCGMDEIFSSVKKSIHDRAERKAAYGIISQNENP